MMAGYSKLFSSILASTIWREDTETRIVWITLLAMAGRDGVAEASVPGLADFARVSVDGTRAALVKLLAPDPDSRTPDHEGRRIEAVDGGWLLLNHAKYRQKMNEAERREYKRIKQAGYRARVVTPLTSVDERGQGSPNVDAVDTIRIRIRNKSRVQKNTAVAREALAVDRFEEFYFFFPRKKAPKDARKAWSALRPTADLQENIIAALRSQLPELQSRPADRVPYPASWLRGEHWKNEPDKPSTVTSPAAYAALRTRAERHRRLVWATRCEHEPHCLSYPNCIDAIMDAMAKGETP